MTTDIDEVGVMMRESVENIRDQFDDPQDDFIPVLSLLPQDGQNVMLALDGRWLENDDTKNRLVKTIMIPAIEGVGAKTVATVFSAWQASVPEDTDIEDMPRPSEAENKEEVVLLTVMDSFTVKTWMNIIERSEDSPPTLKGWEELPMNAFSGRFIDSLQQALRDSSGKTDPDFMKILEKQGIELSGE